MANTPTLNIEHVDVTSNPPHFTKDLETERVLNALVDDSDTWAGKVTSSFYSSVIVTGSAEVNLGTIGSWYTPVDRVIKEVVAWAAFSGSGGVTRVDCAVQGPAGNFVSVFSDNALKPAVSASLGDFGIAKSSTFISGSNMRWAAGKLMRVSLDTAATTLQRQLTVQVSWYPSGSW